MDGIVQALMDGLGFFYYILVYGVGLLAMALSVIAFQFPHRVTIVLCNFWGQASWILYFLLQGDTMSAFACTLSAVMLAVFSKQDKWKWATGPVSVAVFLALLGGFSLITFREWSDIFPLLAGAFGVMASSRKSEKTLRQLSLFWCAFWLCNSIVKFYPVALANDLFCTISTVVALIRYRKKEEEHESKS